MCIVDVSQCHISLVVLWDSNLKSYLGARACARNKFLSLLTSNVNVKLLYYEKCARACARNKVLSLLTSKMNVK